MDDVIAPDQYVDFSLVIIQATRLFGRQSDMSVSMYDMCAMPRCPPIAAIGSPSRIWWEVYETAW